MSLQYRIDAAAHAALPPAHQAAYKADGDGFVVDIDEPTDEAATKRELDRTRGELKGLKERAALLRKTFATDDSEAMRRMIGDAEARALNGPMTPEEFQRQMDDLKRGHDGAVAEIETAHARDAASRNERLLALRIDAEIDAAMRRAGVREDALALLRPHLRSAVRIECTDPLNAPLVIAPKDGLAGTVANLLESWRVLDATKSRCFITPVADMIAKAARNGTTH